MRCFRAFDRARRPGAAGLKSDSRRCFSSCSSSIPPLIPFPECMLGRLLSRRLPSAAAFRTSPPSSPFRHLRAMSSDLTERLAALSIKLDSSAVVHHGPVQGAAQWKEALQGKDGVPESCPSRTLCCVSGPELTRAAFSAGLTFRRAHQDARLQAQGACSGPSPLVIGSLEAYLSISSLLLVLLDRQVGYARARRCHRLRPDRDVVGRSAEEAQPQGAPARKRGPHQGLFLVLQGRR